MLITLLTVRMYVCASVAQDTPKCDLLIVMGTSLVVYPFASIVDRRVDRVVCTENE